MEILRQAQDDRGMPDQVGHDDKTTSFQDIIDKPFNMQRDDGPATFLRLEEEAVVGVVVEEILRQGCAAEGILEDEKVALPVWISVGIVLSEFMTRQPKGSSAVQAIGQMFTGRLATGCVAGPAAGRHPLLAVPGSVGMNGDQADILLAQLSASSVHALGAGPE